MPSTVVIRCSDHRFVNDAGLFLRSLGVAGLYEDVAVAGAAKNIVDPYDASDTEFVLRQIGIAKKSGDISQVILMSHLDCVAYGKGTFSSADEERARHLGDLAKAAVVIEHRFPGANVVKVLARMDDAGTVQFEKVP